MNAQQQQQQAYALQQAQQQQMLQRNYQQQHQQRPGGGFPQPARTMVPGPGAAQQQVPPQTQSEMVQMQDGNEGLRNAKRRKPTDRSLPSFIPPKYLSTISSSPEDPPTLKKLKPSTESLESLTESYKRMQKVERKLDWNVARRKVEVTEMAGARIGGVKRKLRIHLTTKSIDQPWQVDLSTVAAPSDPAAAPAPASTTATTEEKKAEEDLVVGATSEEKKEEAKAPEAAGEGEKKEEVTSTVPELTSTVPKFEVYLTGELLGPDGEPDKNEESKTLLNWVKRVVVDTDRDANLYSNTGPVDWRRPPPPSTPPTAPGLSLSFPSSSTTRLRLSLYIDHTPNHFGLAPDLATLLDMREGDRIEVLQRVWAYIGGIAGTEGGGAPGGGGGTDGKFVRADGRLKKIFGGQERIPFHHLPEYVNRFLVPPPPTVIEHTVDISATAPSENHVAWDVDITIEDPLKAEVEKVGKNLNGTGATAVEKAKEIQGIDEKIALDCTTVKSTLLKRNFLTAFASSPVNFLSQWLSSQSSDLTLILGGERGIPASSSWREEIRRSENWQGDWVKEGANLLESRTTEGKVRELMARQNPGGYPAGAQGMPGGGQPMTQQQQQQMLLMQQQALQQQHAAQAYGRR